MRPSVGLSSSTGEYLKKFQVYSNSYSSGAYDFYLTESRFVFLKTQPRTSGFGLAGLAGVAIGAGIDRMRRKSYDENLSLDEKMKLDKHNYEIPYGSISMIEPKKGMLGASKREIVVNFLDGEGKPRKADYNLLKQMDDFKSALPWIKGLEGKYRDLAPS